MPAWSEIVAAAQGTRNPVLQAIRNPVAKAPESGAKVSVVVEAGGGANPSLYIRKVGRRRRGRSFLRWWALGLGGVKRVGRPVGKEWMRAGGGREVCWRGRRVGGGLGGGGWGCTGVDVVDIERQRK
jgi:hypothetical protein